MVVEICLQHLGLLLLSLLLFITCFTGICPVRRVAAYTVRTDQLVNTASHWPSSCKLQQLCTI